MTERTIKFADVEVKFIDKMGSDARVRNAAYASFGRWLPEDEFKEKGLIEYLATGLPKEERDDWEKQAKAHTHWTTLAHCQLTVVCKAPIFLARQLVKHQVGLVWNEESRRYIKSDVELYLPDHFHKAPANAKQGASKEVHTGRVWYTEDKFGGYEMDALTYIEQVSKEAVKSYYGLLDAGVAPEEARMVLPLNSMTNWVWTGSLVAFNRVYQQRIDSHAQNVAQEFAHKLGAILYEHFPVSMEALNYGNNPYKNN